MQFVSSIFPSLNIRVFDNPVNIGVNLNIIKAIENARAEYLWLLSDDDTISYSSVCKVLADAELRLYSLIKYNSPLSDAPIEGEYDIEMILESMRSSTSYFSNLLFLSTWVVNVKAVSPSIPRMYMLSFSDCVQLHMPFLITCCDQRQENLSYKLKHSEFQLIDFVPKGRWDPLVVMPKIVLSSIVLPLISPGLNIPAYSFTHAFISGLGGFRAFMPRSPLLISTHPMFFSAISFYPWMYLLSLPILVVATMMLFLYRIAKNRLSLLHA